MFIYLTHNIMNIIAPKHCIMSHLTLAMWLHYPGIH